MDKVTVIVDRNKWACGKRTESCLLHSSGNMCCLGFLADQVFGEDLMVRSVEASPATKDFPNSEAAKVFAAQRALGKEWDDIVDFFGNEEEAADNWQIERFWEIFANTNDNYCLSMEEIEEEISNLGDEFGIEWEFTGDRPND